MFRILVGIQGSKLQLPLGKTSGSSDNGWCLFWQCQNQQQLK
jgi:hypothetical protein